MLVVAVFSSLLLGMASEVRVVERRRGFEGKAEERHADLRSASGASALECYRTWICFYRVFIVLRFEDTHLKGRSPAGLSVYTAPCGACLHVCGAEVFFFLTRRHTALAVIDSNCSFFETDSASFVVERDLYDKKRSLPTVTRREIKTESEVLRSGALSLHFVLRQVSSSSWMDAQSRRRPSALQIRKLEALVCALRKERGRKGETRSFP